MCVTMFLPMAITDWLEFEELWLIFALYMLEVKHIYVLCVYCI